MFNNVVSPSRTYIAICINLKGEHYLRQFYLPPGKGVPNDSNSAAWYFATYLDIEAYFIGCLTVENYKDIKEIENG